MIQAKKRRLAKILANLKNLKKAQKLLNKKKKKYRTLSSYPPNSHLSAKQKMQIKKQISNYYQDLIKKLSLKDGGYPAILKRQQKILKKGKEMRENLIKATIKR
jgi:hypothetical protein